MLSYLHVDCSAGNLSQLLGPIRNLRLGTLFVSQHSLLHSIAGSYGH